MDLNNREIAGILSETAKLMELHEANEFKLKSLQNAAFVISRYPSPLTGIPAAEREQIKGIGKSINQKISEILNTGTLEEYETYAKVTPQGVVQMMHIKGIGPKKVAVLWKQLGVETPGELLYACNENRLVELKGFGMKTQDLIRKAIEYNISSRGFFHYASLDVFAKELLNELRSTGIFRSADLTGEIRRKCELLREIEIVLSADDISTAVTSIKEISLLKDFQSDFNDTILILTGPESVKIKIYLADENSFASELFFTTASATHIEKLSSLPGFNEIKNKKFNSEADIYASLGLAYIEPELREGFDEIDLASANKLPELLKFEDLKGCLHNHSTWSDGLNSLKEMALACRDAGYNYLGICDHSKSAFYANGLSDGRVLQQHEEIDKLNKELAPFIIFKGIESDILHDGSLDYPEGILKKFDFIVASVHSGLKMTKEKATERLLKAIANPYTTILGHPTSRLLLAREGYPLDHEAVIDACAKHNVIIELNANPYRLDMDWRWIRYALSKNVMISVNPDAHQVSTISHMYYGVCAGRKGGLTQKMTFNTLSAGEAGAWFLNKRNSM